VGLRTVTPVQKMKADGAYRSKLHILKYGFSRIKKEDNFFRAGP
jgi:hypothetical protein